MSAKTCTLCGSTKIGDRFGSTWNVKKAVKVCVIDVIDVKRKQINVHV